MASDQDDDEETDWHSSLRDLADRIRDEKSAPNTSESTPVSDWSPTVTSENRADGGATPDDVDELDFEATPSFLSNPESAESATDNHVVDGETEKEAPKRSQADGSDQTEDSANAYTELSPAQSGAGRPEADSSETATESSSTPNPSEDVVDTLGDVTVAPDSEPPEGGESTGADESEENNVQTQDRRNDTTAGAGGDSEQSDGSADAAPSTGTNFGDAFTSDDADSGETASGSSSDDTAGTDTDTPGSELSGLGNLGSDTQSADESETAEPGLGSLGSSSENEAATGSTSDPEPVGGNESGTQTADDGTGSSGTFGDLADRMAASRNDKAGRTAQNETRSATETDTAPASDTTQSADGDRQLPLGANEPEFTTDLAPLVKPNMSAMLLGALKSSPVDQACGRLLRFPNGDDYNLLLVTVTQSPEDRLLTIHKNSGGLPENIGVVAIDNNVSAQNTTQTIPVGGADRTVHIKTATDPGDIKGIGIRISKQLSEWDNNDRPTMVCFHSLTSILQYISTKQLFQFIHLLQNRLRSYDAVVHYHIDPSVHDQMTLSQIKPLLDHVIEVENDGTCWIE